MSKKSKFRLLGGFAFALCLTLSAHAQRAEAAQLVMLEQEGCHWCEVWNEEVGIAYPKTPEGAAAPLRRVDIHTKLPTDLKGLAPGRFTPTFIVWHEGREVGRIQGYPGAHFFWPMLQNILKGVDPKFSTKSEVAPKS